MRTEVLLLPVTAKSRRCQRELADHQFGRKLLRRKLCSPVLDELSPATLDSTLTFAAREVLSAFARSCTQFPGLLLSKNPHEGVQRLSRYWKGSIESFRVPVLWSAMAGDLAL